jgi:hypothetical protein
MSGAQLPPNDDITLQQDDTLPPEHPAGSDSPISAGEVISGEGPGLGAAGRQPPPSGEAAERPSIPGDDS